MSNQKSSHRDPAADGERAARHDALEARRLQELARASTKGMTTSETMVAIDALETLADRISSAIYSDRKAEQQEHAARLLQDARAALIWLGGVDES